MIKKQPIQKIIIYIFATILLACFCMLGFGGAAATGQALAQDEQTYNNERIFKDTLFPSDEISDPFEVTARGGLPIDFYREYVNFSRRTQTGFSLPDKTPHWISNYTCGITAGAVIFGYYNRWINNLIPNQEAGRYITIGNNTRWMWNAASANGGRVFQSQLFAQMGGNPAGVTMQQFLNGMQFQAASRGRGITQQTLRIGHNQLNEAALSNAFRTGQLVSLFMSGYSIVPFGDIRTFANHDLIIHNIVEGNHVMVAYGYRRIRYYNAANQLIRSDLYLYVKTGFSMGHALVPMYRFGEVYNAFITRIF